jgi:hypothetical protein
MKQASFSDDRSITRSVFIPIFTYVAFKSTKANGRSLLRIRSKFLSYFFTCVSSALACSTFLKRVFEYDIQSRCARLSVQQEHQEPDI